MSNRTLVQETASNPGTNTTVNLLGAVSSRRSFASSFSSGQTCFYVMSDGLLSEWGIGTFTSGSPNTLSRTTVIGNSAGTAARLNFTGTTNVYNAVPAERGSYVGSDWGGTATGSANARTVTIGTNITDYTPGMVISFINGAAANTGSATLSVNGLVATTLILGAAALAAGDLPASAIITVRFDGANFRIINVEPSGFGIQFQRAVDSAAGRTVLGAPAVPTASGGVGNWVAIASAVNTAYTLPAGGTWAYLIYGVHTTTGATGAAHAASVAAGGTTVLTAVANFEWRGFAWRIA